jgi:hypothetical protein
MSNDIVRYLVAGFLVVHGIGHAGGYWMFVKSWLSPTLVDSPLKWLFILVWLAALIGFVVAGIGLLQQQSWWRAAAVAASLVSLLVSALFIQGAPFNAAAADVIILLAILALRWPSVDVVGA